MEIDFGAIPDGGGNFLQPGRHFCQITKCEYDQDEKAGDWGYMLTLTCVAGPEHGKTIRDWLYPSKGGDMTHARASRLKILVRECGLLPAGNEKLTLTPELLTGKQVWVNVVMGEKRLATKGKNAGKEVQYPQIDFAGYEAGAAPPDFRPLPQENVPI